MKTARWWIWITVVVVATVFLLSMRPSLYWWRARDYYDVVQECALQDSLDVAMVLAVINVESAFEANAVSPHGAVGLMQLMPTTAQWICQELGVNYRYETLFEARFNLVLGCWYLRYLLNKFDRDWALAAYNAGEGVVRDWSQRGVSIEEIPYQETRQYVAKVCALIPRYTRLIQKD